MLTPTEIQRLPCLDAKLYANVLGQLETTFAILAQSIATAKAAGEDAYDGSSQQKEYFVDRYKEVHYRFGAILDRLVSLRKDIAGQQDSGKVWDAIMDVSAWESVKLDIAAQLTEYKCVSTLETVQRCARDIKLRVLGLSSAKHRLLIPALHQVEGRFETWRDRVADDLLLSRTANIYSHVISEYSHSVHSDMFDRCGSDAISLTNQFIGAAPTFSNEVEKFRLPGPEMSTVHDRLVRVSLENGSELTDRASN